MSFLTERYGDERENTMGLNKIAGEALTGWYCHRKLISGSAYKSSY